MKDHSQFAEDLALFAIGALDAKSCPDLQAHLATCAECRRELESLRADSALLALSATGPQPPQRSRQRLMAALAPALVQRPVQASEPRSGWPWPRWLFWAPMAASVLLAIFAIHTIQVQNENHQEFLALQKELQTERIARARAQEVVDMLNDPKAQFATLVSKPLNPLQPQVKTIYIRDKGHVLVWASNLPEPPPNKAYELWLLPAGDGKLMPAGTFRTDWRGHGMMIHSMQAGVKAKGFAVTMEPDSGSDWPTSPILLAQAQ
jgi:hypothetical protein